MAANPRVPLGSRLPFTSSQFDRLREAFIDCAPTPGPQAEILFARYWPELRAKALDCDQQLAIQGKAATQREITALWNPAAQGKWGNPRKSDPNRFRPLREAARRGDVDWLLSQHPEHADSLLYGAIRAGVAEDHNGLRSLDREQINAAVTAALAPGSVLLGKRGRPTGGPVEDYARYLASVYRKVRGNKATSGYYDAATRKRRGPSIRFFEAALAPLDHYLSLGSHGVRGLIERSQDAADEDEARERSTIAPS